MNLSYERDKIRGIIKRSSIKNYFTPLLPKHSAKPKLSKYSKLLLKLQEPKLPLINSPVSILNYKVLSNKTPVEKPSNQQAERRLSQVPSSSANLKTDTQSLIVRIISPLRRSNDLPSDFINNITPDEYKNSVSPTARALNSVSLRDSSNQISLNAKKNEKILNISQIKCFKKHPSFLKKIKHKEVIKIPKFVSTGENTDDGDFTSWELAED